LGAFWAGVCDAEEKLLAGAKQCLYEKGYARTTARDIVAASGTNLASIGYHFGSKEALLNAAIIDGFGEWGEQVGRALAPQSAGGPAEQLQSMWERVIQTFTTHRPLWVASFEAFTQSMRSPELREQLATSYEQARPWLAQSVQLGDTSIDPQTARSVGSLLLALQAGLAAQWLLDPAHAPSAGQVVDALRTLTPIVSPADAANATRSDGSEASTGAG
jgi:AcrR family transcriptional regulator